MFACVKGSFVLKPDICCVLNGEKGFTDTREMNERHIASQIRFVFQSSSGHTPYWLKPNNLMTCSPLLYSSLPSLPAPPPSPPQREMTRRLSAHHKRQRIPLPDLTSEPLILTMSINHDKDIKLKIKDWQDYISSRRLKDITLKNIHQSGESVKRTRRLAREDNLAQSQH